MWCSECGHERTQRDGLPVAIDWDFEARLIANALIDVGKGQSYRQAAQAMLIAAHRFSLNNGVVIVSQFGGSVHRYLDRFGRLVLDQVEHTTWPEVLLLDALPLRKREVVEDDPFSYEQSGSGAILVAIGYSDPVERRRRRKRNDEGELVERKPVLKRQMHIWKAEVAGGYNRWAWADFLASLPGTPKWIVVDGEAPVRLGIKLRWGDGPDAPIVYSCEGHMQRKFQERALEQDGLTGFEVWKLWPKSVVGDADQPPGPLWTRDHYRRFLDAVLAFPPERVKNITAWINAHNDTIGRQFDLRDKFPGYARGNGPVEAMIVKIEAGLSIERRRVLQNVHRINIMLGLVRAHLGGHDDPHLYARIIRDELERTNGRPVVDWRRFHYTGRVRRGQAAPPGTLFELADRYQRLGENEQRAYWINRQAASIEKKLFQTNLLHFLNGYPPLTLTTGKTPSIARAGLKLSAFPLIAREWDPANEGDPATTDASTRKVKKWICFEDNTHRWETSVQSRTARLTGCLICKPLPNPPVPLDNRRAKLARIRDALGPLETPADPGPLPMPAPFSQVVITTEEDEELDGVYVSPSAAAAMSRAGRSGNSDG